MFVLEKQSTFNNLYFGLVDFYRDVGVCLTLLFIELPNRNHRVCLTLDCSGINKDGPGKFRTEADKPDFQNCYFNLANDEQAYNDFVSKGINEREPNYRIEFKFGFKSKINRDENFDAK